MNSFNKTSNYHINSYLPSMHEKKMPTNPAITALQAVSPIKSCDKWVSVHKPTTNVIQELGPAAPRVKTDKALLLKACKKATREK